MKMIENEEEKNLQSIKQYPNIALYGMSGSGKDTVADYLRDNYGYVKLRLAKTIKSII